MTELIDRLGTALEGRYRMVREVGKGGMAVVFLADDLRHDRNVALKVLKPELTAVVGAERFLSEIKTTAGLQHPNILPLYDSGEADSFLYYVMPYVEQQTLRERIDAEGQLPVEEAVRVARNIAEALDYAHRRGVIHRDIKPANVMLIEGKPIVSDFGIALAVDAAGGGRLTDTGIAIGTPHYMSPEQATGDGRLGPWTDIYALGCVVYEMLVGEPPHTGATAQAVLGQIITSAPVAVSARRPAVPPNVDSAVRKALERLPADRFANAGEFAKALSDRGFRYGLEETGRTPTSVGVLAYAGWIVALLLGLMGWFGSGDPGPGAVVERFPLPFAEGQELGLITSDAYELSPDGSVLVYRYVGEDDSSELLVRRWEELESAPIVGSDRGTQPAISPDGGTIAFVQGDAIMITAMTGGPVRSLADGRDPLWAADGYVYASDDLGTFRVEAARGGELERVTAVQDGEQSHVVVDVLPGSRQALVVVTLIDRTDEIRLLDLASGEMQTLVEGSVARYSSSGHLVYLVEDGALMAAAFDPDRGELSAARVALVGGVGGFSLSESGRLFYTRRAGRGGSMRQLVWVDRAGQVRPVDSTWVFDRGGANQGLSISSDGSRLVLRELTEEGLDIWMKVLDDGPRSRLTFERSEERKPVWAPDGSVTFLSDRNGNLDVWRASADGTGTPELLVDLDMSVADATWSPDGEWLVLRTAGAAGVEGGRDIVGVHLTESPAPVPLLTSPFDEVDPAISPDGRFMAYTSNETGRFEVYVRPFPDVASQRWQVSSQGGRGPRWADDGSEIFFVEATGDMASASVETEPAFRAGPPLSLFRIPAGIDVPDLTMTYAVAPDGQRFVMSMGDLGMDDEGGAPSVLVTNFTEELTRMVPR